MDGRKAQPANFPAVKFLLLQLLLYHNQTQPVPSGEIMV